MTESGSRLPAPATLRRVSFWLVVGMTAAYVGVFEAAYRSNAACRGAAQWIRVVVEPPLPGVPEPVIAIGSNAGYVVVVSGAECKAGKTNDETGRPARPVVARNGRVRFLWRWLKETWGGSRPAGDSLPRAAVVPLSRVLCMYDEPANPVNDTDASSLSGTARTAGTSNDPSVQPVPAPEGRAGRTAPSTTPEEPDANSPRLEKRLITEIRNKLEEKSARCDDLRISPPIVFRPRVSDEPAATAGPDSVEHAVRSLRLDDADRAKLYVFGYASADGPRNYNQTLSEQRAAQVVRTLDPRTRRRVARTFPMGEDHLVNGVAESRGARLVACVPPQPSQ